MDFLEDYDRLNPVTKIEATIKWKQLTKQKEEER